MGVNRITGMTNTSGTFNQSGNGTAIAGPGATKRIVISAFNIQNEGTVAQTVLLQTAGTAVWRILAQTQGSGQALVFPPDREIRLNLGDPLLLNLSAANPVGYSIQYWLESQPN